MLQWINFLHIYQPPKQDGNIIKQVTDESYLYLIWLLKKYPLMKITLNVSGSLVEHWLSDHNLSIIKELKNLVNKNKIELVGSAMYHPILPLLPAKEIKIQICLNQKVLIDNFGGAHKIRGFFMPEMAYDKKTADIIKSLGFAWLIADEIHYNNAIDNTINYTIKNNGLSVIFRDRRYSKSFPPELIIKNISQLKNRYLITAHDGETYGHWHKDEQNFCQKAFTRHDIINLTASEYLKKLKTTQAIVLRPANWESSQRDIKNHVPFALWNNPKNKIQNQLWRLAEMAIKTTEQATKDPQYCWARYHLNRGLASCSWWWAAGQRPAPFSPITWNPTEIERGLDELITSIRSLETINKKTKLAAEKLYIAISKNIWHKHWKKYYILK